MCFCVQKYIFFYDYHKINIGLYFATACFLRFTQHI